MKKICLSILISIVLFSCSTNNLIIKGIVENNLFEGYKVYLLDERDSILDSTEIHKGKFRFKLFVDTVKMGSLYIGDKEAVCKFIYEKGDISVVVKDADNVYADGTILNNIYTDFLHKNRELDKKYENAMNVSEKAAKEVEMEYVNLAYDFTVANHDNIVGKIAFLSAYWGMSIEQKENIINVLDESFKQESKIAKIISNIEQEKRASVGNPFIDFVATDINSNEITLSNMVGKTDYLMIDFWASWCGPCIKSLPSLKMLYDKNQGKKFDIIGVSLDSDRDKWLGAISKYELKWTNVSDLKKWDSYMAKIYAVSFIPTTILIDKEGKIIGRNLHINEIDDIINNKK